MAAEVSDPTGLMCQDCGEEWGHVTSACPACSSAAIAYTYPEIPGLDHDPLLALVLAVEGQIPRTEAGAILHRDMVAWLRFHGVWSRAEMLTWEWFFREIASIRSRIVEEMMAPPPGKGGEDEKDE